MNARDLFDPIVVFASMNRSSHRYFTMQNFTTEDLYAILLLYRVAEASADLPGPPAWK
jgi:hypothetical protein